MTFEIECSQPFHAPSLLEFLARRVVSGLESVADGHFRRAVSLAGETGEIAVEVGRDRLRVTHDLGEQSSREIAERVRRIFDTDAEAPAIARALGGDPLLGERVASTPGVRVPGCWDGFELAVRAVLGQQVTVRGAATLAARLVEAYGRPTGAGRGGLTQLFPTPAVLAEADLSEVGLPRTRAETVRSLAGEVGAGRLTFDPGVDPDEFRAELTSIRGIGAWTAEYVAMRALRDPDAFPAGDLVLRRAAGGAAGPMGALELGRLAEAWRPWRAYAAVYLWRSVAERAPRPRR